MAEYRAIFDGAGADLRLLGALQMEVVSQCREQAKWIHIYRCEVKKEIPDGWCFYYRDIRWRATLGKHMEEYMRATCLRAAVLGFLTVLSSSCGSGGSSAPTSKPSCTATTFAYVTNSLDNTVSTYTVNSCTGNLTPTTPDTIPTGNAPYGVAVDPSGRFAYVSNGDDTTLSMFTINSSTGKLTPNTPATIIAAGNGPLYVGSGSFRAKVRLYAANSADNTVSMYTINLQHWEPNANDSSHRRHRNFSYRRRRGSLRQVRLRDEFY